MLMSANSPAGGTRRVKPVKRPRGPQVLTFLFTFLQPAIFGLAGSLKESPMRAATRKHPYVPVSNQSKPVVPPVLPPVLPPPSIEEVNNVFIDALVQACSCRPHARSSLTKNTMTNPGYLYHKARRRKLQHAAIQTRSIHQATAPSRLPARKSPLSREECINMLDYYREPYCTAATATNLNIRNDPIPMPMDRESPPRAFDADNQTIQLPRVPANPSGPTEPEDLLPPNLGEDLDRPPDDPDILSLHELPWPERPTTKISAEAASITDPGDYEPHPDAKKLVLTLTDRRCTHHEAFAAYSSLPSPGVAYLSNYQRRLLFRRLSTIERKDRDSMLRYLSVIDDMKSLNLALTESEWNSAISFSGRCFQRITSTEIESALLTWKEMEQQAHVKSGPVTFNILFDMAAKAGKFVLAEMILREMQARNLPLNRHARVGFIYYHGLRGDGDGVRRAYRDFVDAGEIVDTFVVNCVIASLMRAGEPAAAEHVYERMKLLLAKHSGTDYPLLDWQETRDLGRVLNAAAQRFRGDQGQIRRIQDEQVLAPDLHTFNIFIEYHVSTTGEMRQIAALLSEMQALGVPLHGRIFLKLFKGFAFHGGMEYTSWTRGRLESVWHSLLVVMDDGAGGGGGLPVTKWLVWWVVKAFGRCCGRERTLDIWDELRSRWKPGEREEAVVMSVLRKILG